MPYESLWDVWNKQAETGKAEIERAKAKEQLPLAQRDLLSQIESRESASRYTDALSNRSEQTLPLDVAIKKAESMEKTQQAIEFVNNKEYRDQANKLTWMTNEAKLKMAVEDPETFGQYVMAADRYNNAKAAEAEYDVSLKQEYSMLQEYYNIAESAGDAGNYEGANQYIESVAKKYGRPVPQFLQGGFNGESQIAIRKAINNNVLDRDVAQKLAEPKTPGTLEERLIAELPPNMQAKAKGALLNKLLYGSNDGSEFERNLTKLVADKEITPEEASAIRLNKVKNDASGKQSRVSIVNGPDGPQVVIEEGSNLGTDPVSANRADELVAQRDFLVQGVDMIDSVISDPQTLGAVASVAKAIRTGTKVTEDLFETFPGAAKVVETATNMVTSIVDPKEFDEVNNLFSPTLDQISIMENSIGLLLARSRTPDNRIPVDVIKKSIDDVQLSGLRSDEQIRNRLSGIKEQLERQVTNLNKRIPGQEKKVIRYDSTGNRL